MYELIFREYINKLEIADILKFASLNDITLTEKEATYIFKTLKNNYQFLLGNNYMLVFKEAKNYLSEENYDKVFNLYIKYRLKYQDFLQN